MKLPTLLVLLSTLGVLQIYVRKRHKRQYPILLCIRDQYERVVYERNFGVNCDVITAGALERAGTMKC